MSSKESTLLRLSFLFSLFAVVGSLFASEVLKYPPCVLCWYQRIFMFPLVAIFFVALWKNDSGYLPYAVTLSSLGLATAVYHNLLYFGVIPEKISPCTGGVSCSTKQLEIFGFITIPLMSFAAFGVLVALGVLTFKARGSEKK